MSKYKPAFFSAKAIVIKNKKLLLIHEEDHWELPGGRRAPYENPVDTVKREFKEELTSDIKLLNKLPLFFNLEYKGNPVIVCYYFIKPLSPLVVDGDEALEYKYLTKKDIRRLKKENNLMPFDALFLEQIFKELKGRII